MGASDKRAKGLVLPPIQTKDPKPTSPDDTNRTSKHLRPLLKLNYYVVEHPEASIGRVEVPLDDGIDASPRAKLSQAAQQLAHIMAQKQVQQNPPTPVFAFSTPPEDPIEDTDPNGKKCFVSMRQAVKTTPCPLCND